MSQGFHHIPHHSTKTHSALGKLFDKSMYVICLIAPIMTIPQLLDIWVHHKAGGVSIITWGAYALVSGVWFLYGIYHKEKPLILVNFLLLILQGTIALGIVLFR